ncbi:lipopolysaccharide biosynthesis protein [Terrabacter sp. Soil811]|uniref:lipopolysaccharide biosynthesis protein n=1 Tax=Terrabacter sp. Soil811 TaxID=1736419 RepID=UPI0012E3B1B5|nr:polysaccharide biosynthesis C-terminal domain-containing protein [Terrabacter sp. Soil811]
MSTYIKLSRTLRSREASVVMAMGFMAASASLFAVLTSRWLGPADRGVVVVTATTGSLLMLLGSLGVSTGGRVLLARTPALPLSRYLSVVGRLASVHIATASVVGLGVLWVTNSLNDPVIGLLFVPYAVLMLLTYLLRECLHGLGRHTTAVRGDIATTSVQTILVLCSAPFGLVSLRFVLGAMLAGQAVQVLLLLRSVGRERRAQLALNQRGFKDVPTTAVIRFSLSAVPVLFGQAFVIRGDRLLLGAMSSPAAVGIYGAAATFTELLWLISSGVSQIAFKRSTQTGSSLTSARHRRYALALTAGGCVTLAVVAPFLIPLLLGESFNDSVPLVWVLSVAALPMASYQIDVAVLNGLGHMRRAAVITAAGSGTLGGLCLLLIPRVGASGAAYASLAAYSVLALLARAEVRRRNADLSGS